MHCNTCLKLHMPHAEVWSLVLRRTVYLITKIELFFFIDFFILIEKNIVFHLKYSGLADRPTDAGRPPPPSGSELPTGVRISLRTASVRVYCSSVVSNTRSSGRSRCSTVTSDHQTLVRWSSAWPHTSTPPPRPFQPGEVLSFHWFMEAFKKVWKIPLRKVWNIFDIYVSRRIPPKKVEKTWHKMARPRDDARHD